ncbi:hypothetical protein AC578_5820 [Pseudocercospora eumusae]|uniref:Uncharacterized protein n=1 Tax=Pseudocercospora eumusae TaxID=321146 RepID=A0A139HCC2_9PEZI|nr:hypothetical protein AC578_5820 [Pseudocercospora eumusae]
MLRNEKGDSEILPPQVAPFPNLQPSRHLVLTRDHSHLLPCTPGSSFLPASWTITDWSDRLGKRCLSRNCLRKHAWRFGAVLSYYSSSGRRQDGVSDQSALHAVPAGALLFVLVVGDHAREFTTQEDWNAKYSGWP